MNVTSMQPEGSDRKDDRWDFMVQRGRVHRSVYTDPAIFKREMTNVFGGTWVCVGHESEIPQPNSFVRRRFGGRPVILTRDNKGDIHVLFNRCTHKGATICREDQGSTRVFVCPYHAWSYDLRGHCVAVPLDHAYEVDRSSRENNLLQIPRIESYRGFVFGTLNADAPELKLHLAGVRGPLDEWLDRYGDGKVEVSGSQTYRINANWKFVTDNQGDPYHANFSHRSLLSMTAMRYGKDRDMSYFSGNPDDTNMFVEAFDNGHYYVDQRPEMYAESGWQQQRPQPGREHYEAEIRRHYDDEEAKRLLELATGAGMNLTIFPNLLLIGNQYQLIDPISVDETELTWFATTVSNLPDEINTLRMRTQEDFPLFGEVDDVANFEACQSGLAIAEDEWIDCSRHLDSELEIRSEGGIRAPVTSDLPMRTFFHEWQRLMRQNLKFDLSDQRREVQE